MGFEVLGFGVQGMRFGVWGSGFGGSRFVVWGLEFRVQGLGFRVQGSGFTVQGGELRGFGPGSSVPGLGFRFQDVLPHARLTSLSFQKN